MAIRTIPPNDQANTGGQLQVCNRMGQRARLRFGFAGYEFWDTCLDADSQMRIPDFRTGTIDVTANYMDPATKVFYTVACCIDTKPFSGLPMSAPIKLVAKMVISGGVPGFTLTCEPASRVGEVVLLNLTACGVNFELRFRHTPFVLMLQVPTQETTRLGSGPVCLAATVYGYTTEAIPVEPWATTLAVTPLRPDEGFPQIIQLPHHSRD